MAPISATFARVATTGSALRVARRSRRHAQRARPQINFDCGKSLARPIQQRSATARSAVLRKDILHLTARKTGIHNMPKSGGRKGRPQGCSLCSHRLRRLKPLTPTLSPAAHSAMPSMLPCCTSDLNRRGKTPAGADCSNNVGGHRGNAGPTGTHDLPRSDLCLE